MKTMSISQFKIHCLKIVEKLQSTGQSITLTKRGKVVAKIVPHHHNAEPLWGCLQDHGKIKSDLIKPIGEKWHAEED
jgi:antitoxin (DNA-binding transcriptional repressor) of toxin-antitoxin stability system